MDGSGFPGNARSRPSAPLWEEASPPPDWISALATLVGVAPARAPGTPV